jgi:hypothetical protein
LDGRELPGETNEILTLVQVQPSDEGDYTVAVTNPAGVAVSDSVRLYVVPPSTSFILRQFTNAPFARLPYFFFLPSNYEPARSYPLICHFHGAGLDETHQESMLAPYPETLVFGSYKQQARDPAILVWPTRRAGDLGWTPGYLLQVSQLLDLMMSNYNIDTNRVYVSGYSEGVHAAWDLMGLRPGFFAAVRSMSGWAGSTPAASIKEVPLWNFHAVDDETVPVAGSRSLVRMLRNTGGCPIYTEFGSGGHVGGILQALCIPTGVDWFLAQRQGVRSTVGPLLSITNPPRGAVYLATATDLHLSGSAEAPGAYPAKVAWANLTNSASGSATGTNAWNVADVPLQAYTTNMLVVTATTTSWAPGFGGNTTFNDSLAVVPLPMGAILISPPSGPSLNWLGGVPPFRVQRTTNLGSRDWVDVLTNALPPVALPLKGRAEFYRVIGQ